jgi:hypothetical protein
MVFKFHFNLNNKKNFTQYVLVIIIDFFFINDKLNELN